jgi:5-methylcytosine-specific restriction endonuclease McrA
MNHYTDSEGNKRSKSEIDRLVREAKRSRLNFQVDTEGYNFCESCGTSFGRLDVSHKVSVDDCQKRKEFALELAWDIDNLQVLCRQCHQKYDKLDLRLKWKK